MTPQPSTPEDDSPLDPSDYPGRKLPGVLQPSKNKYVYYTRGLENHVINKEGVPIYPNINTYKTVLADALQVRVIQSLLEDPGDIIQNLDFIPQALIEVDDEDLSGKIANVLSGQGGSIDREGRLGSYVSSNINLTKNIGPFIEKSLAQAVYL